ncbi:MAG: hypothetical protein GF383_11695 [Candidatus Lokiarchaeota archaeon]|nr:hypothetical protein [Candidatus Lokiarchaeota archaeon]MBD3341429.1 hypothetical protein [Candidatus Lokiarchaeota archaeon]
MLYSLFLYQHKSGIPIYEKNLSDVSNGNLEMFSAFFSALQSFISELVLSGSKELRAIELGDYTVVITNIEQIDADLVLIADKEDEKLVHKIIPKIIKSVLSFKNLFEGSIAVSKKFRELDGPITQIIYANRKLVKEDSLIKDQVKILESIWSKKKDLSPEERKDLLDEKENLVNQLNTEISLTKLKITKRLLEISELLKDNKSFVQYQKDIKQIKDEINDKKIKLKYYLERIKASLSQTVDHIGGKKLIDGDYKDLYLNLYSFSTKLKSLVDSENWKKYYALAKSLIEKEEITNEEFSQNISEIVSMKDDIEFYLE